MSNIYRSMGQALSKIRGIDEPRCLNEAPEDQEPASPDESGMAMDQLKFMAYAANEIMQHIQNGGEFPEWMQNKLSGTFEKMKSLHANIDHENVQDQKESVELKEKKNWDRAQKELESKKRMQSDDREFEKTAAYIRALEGSTKEKATKLLSDYINSKIRNLDVKDQIVKILKNNGMWKKNAVFVEGVELEEKLKVSDGLGAWISDFKKSDAPQFKGKSDEEKKNMAIAAFTDAGGKLDEASEFKPHMMYDPKTGKAYKAEKPEDHERMAKMGYTHDKPEMDEAYKTPSEAKAYEDGKKAVAKKVSYDDNPNKKGTKEYTAWSKGHNDARAKMIGGKKKLNATYEEVELEESPIVTFTVPNVTSDMASKLERIAKEKKIEYSRKGRTVVLKGKRIDMTMLRTKMGLAQTNIPMVPVNEEVELEEGKSSTGYELYHKDFSSAMKHAYDHAKKKFGIEIDPKEIDDKVASGPRKPSKGKTNSYRLKGKDGKKAVQIQVYGMDNGKYELNMYKESVELEEAREHEYSRAVKALKDYANKNGGIDKADFHTAANHLDNLGKASLMQKSSHLAKYNNHVRNLDTDVRDRIQMTLRKHGMMESKEATEHPMFDKIHNKLRERRK